MKLIQWFSNFEIVDRRKTKMLTYNDFYYCYDVKQMVFLRYKMGIPYICVGLHEKTKGKFFQFHKTSQLQEGLRLWRDKCKEVKK